MSAAILIIFILGTAGIFTSGKLYIDILLFVYKAEVLLNGGRLYRDIIDINSPLIYFYSLPSVWLSRHVNMAPEMAIRIYTTLLTGVVLAVCFYLFRMLFGLNKNKFAYIALAITGFLFYFCGETFIQRDYLISLFLIPYFLLILIRLEKKEGVSVFLKFFLGFGLGMALLLKPNYFVVVIISEVLVLLNKRKLSAAFTVENLGLVIGSLTAFFAIYAYSPLYVKYLVQAVKYYSAFPRGAVIDLRILIQLLWVGIVGLCTGRGINKSLIRNLYIILIISIMGGLSQMKGFPYHYFLFDVVSILVFSFYGYVFWLENRSKTLFSLKSVLGWSTIFLCGLSMLTYNIGRPLLRMYYPLYPTEGPIYERYIEFVSNNSKNKSFAVFSIDLYPFGLLDYSAGVKWATRYLNSWSLPGFYVADNQNSSLFPYHKLEAMTADEREYFQITVEDLLANQPSLIIVQKPIRLKNNSGVAKFNYIDYFSMDSRFVEMMKEYTLIQSIDPAYQAYQRRG